MHLMSSFKFTHYLREYRRLFETRQILQNLAFFGTKEGKNNNYQVKKKKAISSQNNYGTPKTGLILNSKQSVLGSQTSGSEREISKETQFSPLLDQSNSKVILPQISPSIERISSLLKTELDPPISSENSLLDLSSMYDEKIHLPMKPDFSDPKQNFEPATQLGDELMKYIGVIGLPITIAEYMRRCLRDDRFGYYTNPPRSDDDSNELFQEGNGHRLIGQAGDFTTAPEISQIFGECITIWLLTQYEALGKPSKIQLVELGPGRGTLICDILRAALNIKGSGESFINALIHSKDSHNGIHLVEVSGDLRTSQKDALQKFSKAKGEAALRFHFAKWSTNEEQHQKVESLISKLEEKKRQGEKVDDSFLVNLVAKQRETDNHICSNEVMDENGVHVYWHDNFDFVPFRKDSPVPTFIIAQEFMDALPVHVFQKYQNTWREHLVDIVVKDEEDAKSKVQVTMRDGTISTTYSSESNPGSDEILSKSKKPRFRKVLSPGVTPALKGLLQADDDGCVKDLDHVPDGTIIEVCPEALSLVQDIAQRIEHSKGAALIIDYGEEGSGDSLRAFKKHKQIDVMSYPGTVDITADVDFLALKNAVNRDLKRSIDCANLTVEAFGPKTQGEFLASMGAVERTISLIEDDATTDEQAEELCFALERLIAENEMGKKFKVLSIARKKSGIFPPAGF